MVTESGEHFISQAFIEMWIDSLVGYLPGETCRHVSQFVQNEYVGTLGQLYVTIRDLKQAISAFVDSVNGEENKNFLAFDAHVSDCGCHLRASMSMDLIQRYRGNREELLSFLGLVEACDKALVSTSALMKDICTEAKSLKELQLPKSTKDPLLFLSAIGWKYESDNLSEIKYIFYCYVLSQFKTYSFRNKQDSVHIDTDKEFKQKNEMICTHTCQGKGKLGNGCRYLKHARIGKAALKQWTLCYQERLSKMSVDYLAKSDSELKELVENSRKESHKSVAAVPSYVQFKISERLWASNQFPFLLSMRVFVDEGHEDIYARAFVGRDLKWNIQFVTSDVLEDTPHIIVAGHCRVPHGYNDTNKLNLANLSLDAHQNMRSFWYSFMSQHKQYPFDTALGCDDDLQNVLPAHEFKDYMKFKYAGIRAFRDMEFTPKHIFVEYPSVVFSKQRMLAGKQGVLFI
ncbi:hypothetical protein OXX69_008578 [Metschnikowia pulcherrima]